MAARERLVSVITILAICGKVCLVVNTRKDTLGIDDFVMSKPTLWHVRTNGSFQVRSVMLKFGVMDSCGSIIIISHDMDIGLLAYFGINIIR